MATFKEIGDLRKSGQLDAAYELASAWLTNEPDNVWAKRAMSWVRYERLKMTTKTDALDDFLDEWKALNALIAINPDDEVMLTTNVTWQAVSRLFAVREQDATTELLNSIFTSLQQWTLERPSELYSALLKAFLKAGKAWSGLDTFLGWWDLTNLRPEDYLPIVFADGQKGMALAEQAYIAYAKQLLTHPEPQSIKVLIGQLETLAEQHPEYQYPSYYQAKLLASTGSKVEALTALLPFARRKQREFWLWDLLADLFADEPSKAIACLCKAVSCPTQEKFLVKVRLKLSGLLKEQGLLNEAYTEFAKVIQIRQQEGWPVSSEYMDALKRFDEAGAVIQSDNKKLYPNFLPLTDDLLYEDVPEQIGVVTHLNTDKKIAHFMVSQTVTGHFKYEQRMSRVQPGDFVALRLEERTGKDGLFWVPLSVKPTKKLPSDKVFKAFSGPLRRVNGKDFGFVGDVFLSPTLLKTVTETSEETVSGEALLSFDKVKQAYAWKALQLKSA
jgi:hypothetical protein